MIKVSGQKVAHSGDFIIKSGTSVEFDIDGEPLVFGGTGPGGVVLVPPSKPEGYFMHGSISIGRKIIAYALTLKPIAESVDHEKLSVTLVYQN